MKDELLRWWRVLAGKMIVNPEEIDLHLPKVGVRLEVVGVRDLRGGVDNVLT